MSKVIPGGWKFPHGAVRDHLASSVSSGARQMRHLSECLIRQGYCTEPFFFLTESTVSENIYLHVRALHCTSEEFQSRVAFQQDGATPHKDFIVHQFLNTNFPNWWIWMDCSTSWPPHLLDITLLLLSFLLGYTKGKVFSSPVTENVKAET